MIHSQCCGNNKLWQTEILQTQCRLMSDTCLNKYMTVLSTMPLSEFFNLFLQVNEMLLNSSSEDKCNPRFLSLVAAELAE